VPDRPNVLFLMSDQHRADVTGYEGDSVVRTPVLDRLAETGVVFRNAYTPAPVCVPARQCMMAGQLPKTCDCQTFWDDLPAGHMTFSRRFSQYAYHTVCSGKLHHHGQDQMQGWTKRVAPDADVAAPYIEGLIEEECRKYRPAAGTGKWSNQRELEEARAVEGPYQVFDQRAVQAGLDYLDRHFDDAVYLRPQSHRPLLFKLSLLQPHYPFFTDPERFEYYLDRVPVYLEETCDHPVLSLSQQGKPVNAPEQTIRRATAAYYGMIDQVDCYFGQTLDHLEALGEDLDEWIIVYTSDHGEMLGQHGIWEKTRFYEASVRVPLIVRWPAGIPGGGRVVDENVNLCDLFATLCDMAGLETPAGLDSRSLVPLMRGGHSGWNDESVSQMGRNHLMIKRGSLKYQYYGEDVPEVLFDLEADPGETVNLADDPQSSGVMAEFRRRRAELGHGPDAAPDYVNAGYCA